MPIQGDVKNLYSDREKTRALFPTTKISAVSDDNGVGLDALMENLLYSGIEVPEASSVPLDADTLEGHPASDFATPSFVTSEIAKAQLSGGSGGDIDLSGFATKDDVNNAVRAIDYPVDSVNGKTGAVQLSADDVGAAPSGFGLGEESQYVADCHAITENGWYFTDDATANRPDGLIYGAILAKTRGANLVLEFTDVTNGQKAEAHKLNGIWSEWKDISASAFAPAGYGLGANVTRLRDYTSLDINSTGFYGIDGSVGEKVPVDENYFWYSNMLKMGAFQLLHGTISNSVVIRNNFSGAEEWVNPPMIPGVEYRTTERWNDRVVYAKCVDCGNLVPGSATAVYPNIGMPIRWSGRTEGGTALPFVPYVNDRSTDITIGVQPGTIFISAGSAREAEKVYVSVWYVQ